MRVCISSRSASSGWVFNSSNIDSSVRFRFEGGDSDSLRLSKCVAMVFVMCSSFVYN